jgi:hypothetical protein
MYAEANEGHPSKTIGGGYEIKSAGFRSKLIWTSLKFSRPVSAESGNPGSVVESLPRRAVGSAVSLRLSRNYSSIRNRPLLNLIEVNVFHVA